MNTPLLRVQRGGVAEAEPVLLLLHGLGATSDVWRGFTALLEARGWRGRWIAPDFPGHGGSAPLPAYNFAALAAAVAPVVPRAAQRLLVLGHSLGGAVALELSSGRHGVAVAALCAIGIKFSWTAEELARAQALSTKPNPAFATRAAAAERHLKLAGLTGLVAADAVADAALRAVDGGWSAAFDPLAFAVGVPDMPALLAASQAQLLLAAGEHDAMCPAAPLRALWPQARILEGLGHNAQVEDPAALWPILEALSRA